MIADLRLQLDEFGVAQVSFDTFSGLVQEHLVSEVVNVSSSEDYSIDFELNQRCGNASSQQWDEPFPAMKIDECGQYELFVKMNFLQSSRSLNQKIQLRQLFEDYHSANKLQLKNLRNSTTNISGYMFVLADLVSICKICLERIKYSYQQNQGIRVLKISELIEADFGEDEVQQRSKPPQISRKLRRLTNIRQRNTVMIVQQPTQGGKSSYKINSIVKLGDVWMKKNARTYEILLLFRTVFTIKPLQLMAILFNTQTCKVIFNVWNCRSQQTAQIEWNVRKILYKVPNAKQLMKMNAFKELGRRIFLAFKNALIVETFYKLNPIR